MTKSELETRVFELEKLLEQKEKEIQRLKNRGAGRTPKFSDRERDNMIAEYQTGKSIRKIAEQNKCSASYVHKLISEHRQFTETQIPH